MSRPMKYVAGVIAFLVLAAAVTGFAYWSAQYDPNERDPGFFVDGTKVEEPPLLITVGDQDVPFEIYRHYYLSYKAYFEAYYSEDLYEDDPDGNNIAILKQAAQEQIQYLYAWVAIADEMGITLTEEDEQELIAIVEEDKALQGSNYEEYLAEKHYLDEENYMEIQRLQTLVTKANDEYRGQLSGENEASLTAEVDAEYDENYITVKHILIEVIEAEEGAPESDVSPIDEARATAQDLYQQITTAEDTEAIFDQLMHEYSDDPGLAENPDGYTFTEGTMVDAFYETSMELSEGEVSEPIFVDSDGYSGYHIILRTPLSEAGKEENRSSAISIKIDELITAKEEEEIAKLPITTTEAHDAFKAEDIQ